MSIVDDTFDTLVHPDLTEEFAGLTCHKPNTVVPPTLEPWPRLFHNLRGSLETDLMNTYPAHVVVSWLGNSEQTAIKHYLKVTPQHLADATANGVGQQVGTSLAESTSLAGNEGKAIPQKSEEFAIPHISKLSEHPEKGPV